MPLVWKDAYLFGHPDIDKARKAVFDAAFKLAADQNLANARAAVLEMRDYAASMFASEEAIMRTAGYSATQLHTGCHHVLAKRLNQLLVASANAKQERDFVVQVAAVLEMWIFEHFMKEDPKIRRVLDASGRHLAALGGAATRAGRAAI